MRPDAMIFICWMVSFKPTFSLSFDTFIKGSLVLRFLRLLIFLLAMLIPTCASSSPEFCTYSAYKLNKQGDNIQPRCTPFPIWNQSIVPCPVLTVASWPVYRFLESQVRWSGIPISFKWGFIPKEMGEGGPCMKNTTQRHTVIKLPQTNEEKIFIFSSGLIEI